jgi:hydroxyacylglutathione hydrolase
MKLHVLPAGPIETNAYLLTDEARGEAVLVDAPHEVHGLVREALAADGCRLVALLLTHGHWDHTGDAAVFQAEQVPVWAHEADRVLIETPATMEAFALPGYPLRAARIDRTVRDGEIFELLGRTWEVRHVPGHCPGNVLYYLPSESLAFVGDAIFAGSVGRTDFPGGGFEMLERSIRTRIYSLPEETTLFPGHGPETTVGRERLGNPFVPA